MSFKEIADKFHTSKITTMDPYAIRLMKNLTRYVIKLNYTSSYEKIKILQGWARDCNTTFALMDTLNSIIYAKNALLFKTNITTNYRREFYIQKLSDFGVQFEHIIDMVLKNQVPKYLFNSQILEEVRLITLRNAKSAYTRRRIRTTQLWHFQHSDRRIQGWLILWNFITNIEGRFGNFYTTLNPNVLSIGNDSYLIREIQIPSKLIAMNRFIKSFYHWIS